MRAVIITALAAALVAAAPAPAVAVTEYDVVDVYTTVWDDDSAPEATPTPTPQPGGWGSWGGSYTPQAAPAAPAPQPAAASPAAAPAYSGAGQATPSDYNSAVIAHHNAHRANHSAPALTWDDGLAATAQKIGSSCVYAHDVTTDGGGYGQNIAAGAPASNISSVITELFYNNEIGNFAGLYGQATPSNINDDSAFDGWGHFTQVVWKDTTSVGCATVDCSAKGLANTGGDVPPYFTVCNYKSPGNFLGEFAQQVSEPLGQPSISWAET